MAGHTIARGRDWNDVADLIQDKRSGKLEPSPHVPDPPLDGRQPRAVRCVLVEELRRGDVANARVIRTLANRQSLDVRIVDYSEPFRLTSEGGETTPLERGSTAEEIEAALVAIGFDVTDVLIAGSRWLITFRPSRDPDVTITCDRPPYEIGVSGPHVWSVDGRTIEVTDPYDRLPPDAVNDNATLADGAEARYVAGLIGTAQTGIDGEYFFDVPHLYESVTVRPVVVRHQTQEAQTTCVCEIMHIEAGDGRNITADGTTTLVSVGDDYDPASIYTSDPIGTANDPLIGRRCAFVPSGLYLVAHNPRPNELVPAGFYFAVLSGGVWVLDNQASWLEHV